MSRFLISAPNELVADMIRQQLVAGGVPSLPVGNSAKPVTGCAGFDIYVEDGDLQRAREILRAAESVSEAQLIAESESAGRLDSPG